MIESIVKRAWSAPFSIFFCMIRFYFFIVFLIEGLGANCLTFPPPQSSNRCTFDSRTGRLCLMCDIYEPTSTYSGTIFNRSCTIERRTQCIEFRFPSAQSYQGFVNIYADEINALFDPSFDLHATYFNTLYIWIGSDHSDQINRSMIRTLENVHHRTFHTLRLLLNGRGNRTRLGIDSAFKNVSFRYFELFIVCDTGYGSDAVKINGYPSNTTVPDFIQCKVPPTAPTTATTIVKTRKTSSGETRSSSSSSSTTSGTTRKKKKTMITTITTTEERFASSFTSRYLSTSSTTTIPTNRTIMNRKRSRLIVTVTFSLFVAALPCLLIACCVLFLLCRRTRNDLDDLNTRRRDSLASSLADTPSRTDSGSTSQQKNNDFRFGSNI